MSQSLENLNPNRIRKLLNEGPSKEERIEDPVVVGGGGNSESENKKGSEVEDHVRPRKKVATVKPNPRIVDNPEVIDSSGGQGQASAAADEVTRPSETDRPVTSPVGKVPSNPASPLFESGVNTECIQLIRQLWNLREEIIEFSQRICLVLSQCQKRLRVVESGEGQKSTQKNASGWHASGIGVRRKSPEIELTPVELGGASSSPGPLLPLLDLDSSPSPTFPASLGSFISSLKSITANVLETEKQFSTLSAFYAQSKLVLYAKVLHARKYVTHDHLSILHRMHQLITTVVHLLASSSTPTPMSEEILKENLSSTFQLTEAYNSSLESASQNLNFGHATVVLVRRVPERSTSDFPQAPPLPASELEERRQDLEVSKVRILRQVNNVIQNDTPSLNLSLKPLSAIKVLNLYLGKRVGPASRAFTEVLHSNFLKDVGGSRRTGRSIHVPTSSLSPEKFNNCFAEEESRLVPLTSGFSGTPSLLGRAAIKKSNTGEQRVSKSVRTKMYNYFRQTLWNSVGETSSDLLLWGTEPPSLPLVLFPSETFTRLRNSLSLGGQLSGTVSPILSTIDSVSSSLHSFTLLLTWDEKLRTCFEIATKVKRPEQVQLRSNPVPGEWATVIGSKFGEIITTCVTLLDGGDSVGPPSNTSHHVHHPLPSTPENVHQAEGAEGEAAAQGNPAKFRFGIQAEEELLSDEAQLLFRLDATLTYFMSWVMKRSKSWLNSWAVPQFLASSQRDTQLLWQLLKSRESILVTRQIFLSSESTSVRLSAKQRQLCADDLRDSFNLLHGLPNDTLQDVGPICETLSLATLQSCMPDRRHWEGIGPGRGLDPEKPSSYVRVFIDRVIDPVIIASVEYVSPSVQEAVGKHVVQSACEAWLEYILQKKIRFSEWGAVQLLRDFVSLREWIRTETFLAEEARKGILQLEILKRCEGVAFLLLRSPGDVLGVGKQLRKTRRISSNAPPVPTTGSRESSPSVSESSIAEDDIPPEMYVPNQQMWLKLRLRQNTLGFSPCC